MTTNQDLYTWNQRLNWACIDHLAYAWVQHYIVFSLVVSEKNICFKFELANQKSLFPIVAILDRQWHEIIYQTSHTSFMKSQLILPSLSFIDLFLNFGKSKTIIPHGAHTEHAIIRVDYCQQLSSIICKSKIGYFTLIAENETFCSYINLCIESQVLSKMYPQITYHCSLT